MEFLRLFLKLRKSPLRINVDRILGDFANVKTLLELLWCSLDALGHPFQAHFAGTA